MMSAQRRRERAQTMERAEEDERAQTTERARRWSAQRRMKRVAKRTGARECIQGARGYTEGKAGG